LSRVNQYKYVYVSEEQGETKCKKCNQNNRIHDRKVSTPRQYFPVINSGNKERHILDQFPFYTLVVAN